jgi:predicted Zn-dependent protease
MAGILLCWGVLFSAEAQESAGEALEALSAMERAIAESDIWISPEDAYYIGRGAAAQILAAYPPYTGKSGPGLYLNKICLVLAVNSPRPWLYNGYHVTILDSPEINAYASPGGHILVTLGLIRIARSEDDLAAVIAHELAHIQLNHGVEFLEEALLTGELTDIGSASARRAYQAVGLKDRLRLYGDSVTSLVNELVRNGYSQAQEFQADLYALSLLAAAGYEPSALAGLLRALDGNWSAGFSGYNSTHPSPSERLANIAGELAKYPPGNSRSFRQARFNAVMAGGF